MSQSLKDHSVKIKNYKCFGADEQGFEHILPVNIIIGRNNSGKSTLLEIIQYVTTESVNVPIHLWHKNRQSAIILEDLLTENDLRRVFNENTSGGGIPGRSHWEYGKQWIGKSIKWQLGNNSNNTLLEIKPSIPFPAEANNLAQKKSQLNGKIFKRLFAERNILPEPNDDNLYIKESAQGATNVIKNFINKVGLPSELVKKTLLKELNNICNPDTSFTDILCRESNNIWEVYLEENNKGIISLTHTGSGFKTIILVLCFLYLLPHTEKKELNQYIFAFEDLENNLHPALLRRLLLYLRDKAIKEGCTFFFTTHSNVAIDMFSRDENAQILHVTHDGEKANVRTVKTYIENRGILDDLDIRASDLLQANGVIWVEGPSDRLYLNRWIELCSEGKLSEGTHYQCVFYGGRLLAHLSAQEPDVADNNWLNILKVNRNAIIVIDSDKSDETQPINSTKLRINSEIENISGLCWITKGREIENYISDAVIGKLYSTETISQVGQYQEFSEYINLIKNGEGKAFLKNKVLFAEKGCQNFTKEDIVALDLTERIKEICNRIKSWNGIK
ncbi:MAG: ATP-binding protein [Nitrospinae bacterium]|nr:ATP-binding protein [Nitrospinota bacterium]